MKSFAPIFPARTSKRRTGTCVARENLVAIGLDQFIREADGLVDAAAAQVGGSAETWIADNVQVGKTGDTESLPQSPSPGALHIKKQIGVVAQVAVRLEPQVERLHQRRLVFARIVEAVRTLIARMEARLALEDCVRLAGDPVARRLTVRKHGQLGGRARISRRCGCGRAGGLPWRRKGIRCIGPGGADGRRRFGQSHRLRTAERKGRGGEHQDRHGIQATQGCSSMRSLERPGQPAG